MDSRTEQHYSITDLSEQTGVNSVTLRAWERRYGLLKPRRSPKGHRYYDNDDVETVRHILRWLDRGVAISKVKQLLQSSNGSNGNPDAPENNGDDHWQEHIHSIMESASHFRCEKLSQQMAELFSQYPLDTLSSRFLMPLFDQVERKAAQQLGANAEKKFIETELMLRLHSQIHHQNSNNSADKLLLVVLGKDERPWQALLFALACLEAGYRLHLMLDGCELREIPLMVEKSPVAGVICYSDLRLKDPQLKAELERAAAHAKVPFFLAGQWLDMAPELQTLSTIHPLARSLRDAMKTLQAQLGESA